MEYIKDIKSDIKLLRAIACISKESRYACHIIVEGSKHNTIEHMKTDTLTITPLSRYSHNNNSKYSSHPESTIPTNMIQMNERWPL